MSIEVVSFALGGVLIATAIIGGGFEIREIRMPHVGAGVRLVSLLAGSLFIVLGLSVWGAERPHLLAGNSGFTSDTPAGEWIPETTVAEALPEPPASAAVQALQSPSPPAFTGFVGATRFYWDLYGVRHHASWDTNGAAGWVRITYLDPSDGLQYEVDQELALVESEGMFVYQGLNPRYAGTSTPFPEYSPDAFRVAEFGPGEWTIDMACDDQGLCAPVTIVGS